MWRPMKRVKLITSWTSWLLFQVIPQMKQFKPRPIWELDNWWQQWDELNYLLLILCLGGVLIVSTPSEDPDMKQRGVRHCNQGTEEGMLNMWRRMRDEGKITQVINTIFLCVSVCLSVYLCLSVFVFLYLCWTL